MKKRRRPSAARFSWDWADFKMTKSELIEVIARSKAIWPIATSSWRSKMHDRTDEPGTGVRRAYRDPRIQLSLHFRPPRAGRNPKTGDSVELSGKYVPHFKPGKGMRESASISSSRPNWPAERQDHRLIPAVHQCIYKAGQVPAKFVFRRRRTGPEGQSIVSRFRRQRRFGLVAKGPMPALSRRIGGACRPSGWRLPTLTDPCGLRCPPAPGRCAVR